MAWDIPEAAACRAAAKTSKQIVQIGMQDESSGELADAKQWIQQGLPGKITMVESWMSRNTREGHGQWVRPVPSDCNPAHVNWDLFLSGRPKVPFDGYKFINWRLLLGILRRQHHRKYGPPDWLDHHRDEPGVAEGCHDDGRCLSEKDGRQVPDTISVSFEYPNDVLVAWQSTFSNERYGLGEHFLGSKGTIAHVSGSNTMETGDLKAANPNWDEENAPGADQFFPGKD